MSMLNGRNLDGHHLRSRKIISGRNASLASSYSQRPVIDGIPGDSQDLVRSPGKEMVDSGKTGMAIFF